MDPTDEDLETKTLPPLSDAAEDMEEQDDGSVLIALADKKADAPATDDRFDQNLVEVIDESLLNRMARELLDNLELDKKARERRDQQYAEGIKRTGLGSEAPGGASFAGASRVVHPVLTEACIDFSSKAMKELFPAEGPCKTQIIGKATRAKLQRADDKRQYMNWQLTKQIKEYQRELGVLMTQLPLGGSQYMKWWFDDRFERPRVEFVPIDNLLVPFEATDIYTAQRVTHKQQVNRAEFDSRVESGLYADANLGDPPMMSDETASAQAAAKAEGVDSLSYSEDGLRTIYEAHIYLPLGPQNGDKAKDPLAKRGMMPYIFTVDELTGKPLALYRNWDDEDNDKQEKLDWIVDFTFLLWRGAQGIGLSHVIGSLSGAATGALRALLDSAHIANHPSALRLKGNRTSGQRVQAEPGEIAEIEGPVGIDDIRKLAMPYPFPGPSPVLFSLLEFLVSQAKGVVSVSSEALTEQTPNMPVGTALALIEQGSSNFADIHRRLHNSQAMCLSILHRLNKRHLQDHEVIEDLGELVVTRAHFQGPTDIVPVSDPNIYSEGQRYAQLQAVLQMSALAPQMYKVDELHRRAMRLLRVPDVGELLNAPEEPEERDAVAENVAAHKPLATLKSYPEQDHLNHLKVHLVHMASPILCLNQLMALPALPKLLDHCKEHLVALYHQHAVAATHELVEGVEKPKNGDPSNAQAEAAGFVDQALAQELGPLMQAMMQAQQQLAQFTGAGAQPQEPPQVTAAKIREQGASQRAQQELQARNAEAQAKAQLQAQLAQQETLQAQQAQQHEAVLTQITAQLQQQLEEREAQQEERMQAAQHNHAMQLHELQSALDSARQDADRQFQAYMQQQKDAAAEQLAVLQAALAQSQSINAEVDGTSTQVSTSGESS